MSDIIVKVHGMDCMEEVRAIKQGMKNIIEEENLHFDVLNEKLSVDVSESKISETGVIHAIKRSGFKAENWQAYLSKDDQESFFVRNIRLLLSGSSALFLILGFLAHGMSRGWLSALTGGEYELHSSLPILSIIFYALAIILGAWFVAPKAFASVRRWRADMNVLMMIAVIGAVMLSQWFEAAAVSMLFSVALLLESWSVGRARKAIQSLMGLTPEIAHLYSCCGDIVDKPLDQVKVDSICIVRPGERVPFDGVITKGVSYINEAPITGESMPIEKGEGVYVYAGSINGDQTIEFKVLKSADQSTLARIIQMVEAAQSRRAPVEQWVEKFAARYTPIMILLALCIAVVPPLLFSGGWSRWIYEGLVILVIACPCALVISTPVSIVAGLSRAARNGVLIKGGVFLEAPRRLKAIAFDKTGTLTQGKPVVQNVLPLDGHTEELLLSNAGALEMNSDHPIARAVFNEVKHRNIEVSRASDFSIIQGKGAEGLIDGKRYWVGSHKFLHEKLAEDEICRVHDAALKYESMGHSVIVIGCDDHICGLISIADEVKEEAVSVLSNLREAGIEHLVMLTGDNKGTATAASKALKIDYQAELLPEDKVNAVAKLRDQYGEVAMVGDGINDAPAMATSSLGIAMGAMGSDAAIETADIALMTDELDKLPWLIKHSKRTMNIIQQNIGFALGIKAIFIALALADMATLWMAIAADMGASLLVIFNGLRLLRNKKEC